MLLGTSSHLLPSALASCSTTAQPHREPQPALPSNSATPLLVGEAGKKEGGMHRGSELDAMGQKGPCPHVAGCQVQDRGCWLTETLQWQLEDLPRVGVGPGVGGERGQEKTVEGNPCLVGIWPAGGPSRWSAALSAGKGRILRRWEGDPLRGGCKQLRRWDLIQLAWKFKTSVCVSSTRHQPAPRWGVGVGNVSWSRGTRKFPINWKGYF